MTSTLYRHGVVHSTADPFAQALLVDGGTIAWLGADDTADGMVDRVDEVVDLDGALVAPGFVDAHVHLLDVALADAGVDLAVATGPDHLLRLLADAPDGPTGAVLAYGWADQGWAWLPTSADLDRACGPRAVYAARVDGHSALVSGALADAAGLSGLAGWDPSGLVTGDALAAARTATRDLAPDARERAYRAALAGAAARGVVAVHEMSVPELDTREGLATLLSLTTDPASGLPLVVGYRAELCVTADDARAIAADIPGLTGLAGDLSADGSLGSRTAYLRRPYADAPGRGWRRLAAEQVANHVAAVTRAGLQAGFHVIGDAALDEVLLGVRAAADVEGLPAVAGAGHRLEHVEMVDSTSLAQLVLLGLRASVQPAFDATWGGPDGLYAQRLGALRAGAMNPFADLAQAGVPMAFGSDAPVTPMNPWAGVRAAFTHHASEQRISPRSAMRAATRGGWRLAGLDHTGAGELAVGAPAHLAVWRAEELAVEAVDGRFSAWSSDARVGSPLLPSMRADAPDPVCLRCVRAGEVLYDTFGDTPEARRDTPGKPDIP